MFWTSVQKYKGTVHSQNNYLPVSLFLRYLRKSGACFRTVIPLYAMHTIQAVPNTGLSILKFETASYQDQEEKRFCVCVISFSICKYRNQSSFNTIVYFSFQYSVFSTLVANLSEQALFQPWIILWKFDAQNMQIQPFKIMILPGHINRTARSIVPWRALLSKLKRPGKR